MNPVVRNIAAVLAGLIVGGFVNMALVNIGPHVIPLPEGADVTTTEGFRESLKLFTPANFLFPFLAHALGTLSGAFVATVLSATRAKGFAVGVGVFNQIGGIAAVFMFGGPVWFAVADLVLAYMPMACLGWMLARRKSPQAA